MFVFVSTAAPRTASHNLGRGSHNPRPGLPPGKRYPSGHWLTLLCMTKSRTYKGLYRKARPFSLEKPSCL
ncbi:Uncharacterised protein [Bordetella pertussis]|nr:Uncharacterised protein [Bordetella pertussis]